MIWQIAATVGTIAVPLAYVLREFVGDPYVSRLTRGEWIAFGFLCIGVLAFLVAAVAGIWNV